MRSNLVVDAAITRFKQFGVQISSSEENGK
ncbi:hypothetical protein C8J48_0790 [Desmospora activa DSM 45169]|uniref:Uncharacterized protein n=1 Tax=Desmospora activa DSM 45169 TaxID=1121389 RepID=A0A2T4Z8I3_9BACL|nr:hypothetical protein C8J48_0790 [Desmospora activa DSM 45169]